ncbi:hypothetical protein D4764_19G0001850 [Takifugu flavidus]|uniref:Uncharacterized protein n=1 Tax=Takifugu flavidus TaxID=433684 RepID=A0A5C6NS29_9TELE|nr:hypothetical protein D4764_19G0001850 [Takifugu flavidus]
MTEKLLRQDLKRVHTWTGKLSGDLSSLKEQTSNVESELGKCRRTLVMNIMISRPELKNDDVGGQQFNKGHPIREQRQEVGTRNRAPASGSETGAHMEGSEKKLQEECELLSKRQCPQSDRSGWDQLQAPEGILPTVPICKPGYFINMTAAAYFCSLQTA